MALLLLPPIHFLHGDACLQKFTNITKIHSFNFRYIAQRRLVMKNDMANGKIEIFEFKI